MRSKTLRVGTTDTPTQADADLGYSYVDAQLYTNINDPLLRYQTVSPEVTTAPKNIEILTEDDKACLPNLCESWKLTEDHTSITLNLRKGLLSHWRNELTTADIRYSVERSFAIKASVFYYLNSYMGLPSPDFLHVLGDYSFELQTPKPTGVVLRLLCSPWITPLDHSVAGSNSTPNDPWSLRWLRRNSCNWGPYKIAEWKTGQYVRLVANEDYWRGKPAIDTVMLMAIPRRSQRVRMLEKGEIDIAERLLPRDVEYLRERQCVNVISTPSTGVYQLIMNCQMEPFDDVRFRQAMNHACPQEQIIDTVFRGMAKPMRSPCSPEQPGYTDRFWNYDYDPDKAARLLRLAGWKNKAAVPLSFVESSPAEEQVCLIMQESLSKVGVDITLNKLSASAFNEKMNNKELPFASKFTFTAVRDPSYWGLWYKSNTFLNYSDLRDHALDTLLEEQDRILDGEQRAAFSAGVQGRILDLAPSVFVAYPHMNNALHTSLTGRYHVNPDCLSYYWYDLDKQ